MAAHPWFHEWPRIDQVLVVVLCDTVLRLDVLHVALNDRCNRCSLLLGRSLFVR